MMNALVSCPILLLFVIMKLPRTGIRGVRVRDHCLWISILCPELFKPSYTKFLDVSTMFARSPEKVTPHSANLPRGHTPLAEPGRGSWPLQPLHAQPNRTRSGSHGRSWRFMVLLITNSNCISNPLIGAAVIWFKCSYHARSFWRP